MTATEALMLESYVSWIKAALSAERLREDITELTTPFLDRYNDHLQVYAEHRGPDSFLLTDDGHILAELKSAGVLPRGPKREEIIEQLLCGYGVTLRGSELQTTASRSDFGRQLHNLIQAMMSLDDMFVLSQGNVTNVFLDDVANFLDTQDVRYIANAKFSGKSGLDHLMNFVIPKSKRAPERIVQVMNSPRRDRVANMLFAVSDTRDARGSDAQYYTLVNDRKRPVPADIVEAFSRYSVEARPWSEREELARALAA